MTESKRTTIRRIPEVGYEGLAGVLDDALEHAQGGKGKERHALPGVPFENQGMIQLCEFIDSTHGAVFQAAKKAIESTRLPPDRAESELLGAINYLAGAVLVLRRKKAREEGGLNLEKIEVDLLQRVK